MLHSLTKETALLNQDSSGKCSTLCLQVLELNCLSSMFSFQYKCLDSIVHSVLMTVSTIDSSTQETDILSVAFVVVQTLWLLEFLHF